jgi:hypothetical protein
MVATRFLLRFGALVLLSAAALCSDQKTKPAASAAAAQDHPMSQETRFQVIRMINAETVFIRKPFPMGTKGLTIKNGVISPNDEQLNFLLAQTGPAVKPGDRAKITGVLIKEKSIIVEINGGPKKKKKWYEHIEVGVGSTGNTVPVSAGNDSENARGSFVAILFDHYVPEISPEEIKKMLTPFFDFNALNAAEAYVDTLPPKAREAVKNHEVLVGMNREMVVASLGRPTQKIREHDEKGDYEEWIYGTPPQQVEFVRLYGDEVGRVEIMKVDGEKVVRTEKEVEVAKSGMAQPQNNQPVPAGEAGQPGAPTLRRPGEAAPNDDQQPSVGYPTQQKPGVTNPNPRPNAPPPDQPGQPQPQPPSSIPH